MVSLDVKLESPHKPAKPPTNQPNHLNHLQTIRTTHKPTKPPTSQLVHSQTSQIPDKPPINLPKILSFPWRHFLWLGINSEPKNRHICNPTICDRFANRCSYFCVHSRFRISPSPLHCSLPSLIANYNPNHKLFTQLRTLTNFSRRLGHAMLHWKFYTC